jgi:hypothetical protein
VHEQNVFIGCWLRFEEIRRVSYLCREEAVPNAAIFLRRKDVAADREEVGVTVDELEGKHEYSQFILSAVILNGSEAGARDRTAVRSRDDDVDGNTDVHAVKSAFHVPGALRRGAVPQTAFAVLRMTTR